MKLTPVKSTLFSIAFSLLLLAVVFYLSWLQNFVKGSQIIFYTLGTIILIGLFQSVLVWYAISPAKEKSLEEKEKLLEEKINKIYQATESLNLSNELREKGNIMTTETFMENERKMKEVWVVLEDLAVFDKDDGGFYKFNLDNAKKGTNYVYFTSSDCLASIKSYISRITKKRLNKNEPIPKKIELEKGKIEFVFVDPQAFLFISPITIWNPYHDEDDDKKRKVLLDFPKYPAGYHLVVEDDLAEKIYKRLEELYEKSA